MSMASHPFRLPWPEESRDREHTSDYFALLAEGTSVVVDIRPKDLGDREGLAGCPRTSPALWTFSQWVKEHLGGDRGRKPWSFSYKPLTSSYSSSTAPLCSVMPAAVAAMTGLTLSGRYAEE